jgi:hypothetical protein
MGGANLEAGDTRAIFSRHCERSEAIKLWRRGKESWIASSQVLLAMTWGGLRPHYGTLSP